MTYEIYRYIFIGGAALSAAMLLISVVLFFVLRIPRVIGDLNGSNARRAIENIRNQNTSTGEKTYKSSHVNRERGRLTDKITPSGRLQVQGGDATGGAMATSKLKATEVLTAPADATTLLGSETVGGETTLLEQSAQGFSATALSERPPQRNAAADVFEIEFDITYVHTGEVIK